MSSDARTERGFVLVHGGGLGSWCWRDVVPLLDLRAVAVDLPGRPAKPFPLPLSDLKLEHWIDSVARDVVGSGFAEVVLVGHSIAGLVVPAVAARVAAVQELVLVGAVVAPPGQAMVDQHPPHLAAVLRSSLEQELVRSDGAFTFPAEVARELYGSDRVLEVGGALAPEPPGIPLEAAPDTRLPPTLRVTVVRMNGDRAVPPALVESSCDALRRMGCVDLNVVELDATHDVMLSNPPLLAAALNSVV